MPRVLIVDDDGSVRKVASRVLARLGYEVRDVSTGEAALALLDTTGVDVVLIDVSLPGLSGEETLGRLKRSHPDMPVVLMSGFSEDELGVGGVTFLPKPFSSDTLQAAVETALRAASKEKVK